MKTAEGIAKHIEEQVRYIREPKDRPKIVDFIAQALTEYADEKVREARKSAAFIKQTACAKLIREAENKAAAGMQTTMKDMAFQWVERARSEALEEAAKMIEETWGKAYPEDVFVEPKPGAIDPTIRTVCSASMGRHMAKRIPEQLRALKKEPSCGK